MAFYDVAETAALGCHYNLIFGERSNGKTTSVLMKIITEYTAGLGRGLYVRQMDMDIKGQRGTNVMSSLRYGGDNKDINLIELASGGVYDIVKYRSREWYLGKTQDDGTEVWDKESFCTAQAISGVGHDKGATPPRIKTILFDEFIPLNGSYLIDETALFRNLASTSIRGADTVQVFLLANALSWNSPYFEMVGAVKKVRNMSQGETLVLNLGDSGMKVALEYTVKTEGGKKSDIYFDFADEHSSMITNGQFAVPNYPKYTKTFSKKNVKCTYWFEMGSEVVRGRLMKVGRDVLVFCDKPNIANYEVLRDERRDMFFSLDFSAERNHYMSPLQRYADSRTHFLVDAFATGRMFFSTNNVGEDLMYFARTADAKTVLAL